MRAGGRRCRYHAPARYFAFVAPELEHVHLGFEYGAWMTDTDDLLRGAHLKLRKVRFVTYEPGDLIPEAALVEYTRDGARLANDVAPGKPAALGGPAVVCAGS